MQAAVDGSEERARAAAAQLEAQRQQAARDEDMYAPVAARLGCDRPTAKVAVLAAMYGQTSGTAGKGGGEYSRFTL